MRISAGDGYEVIADGNVVLAGLDGLETALGLGGLIPVRVRPCSPPGQRPVGLDGQAEIPGSRDGGEVAAGRDVALVAIVPAPSRNRAGRN